MLRLVAIVVLLTGREGVSARPSPPSPSLRSAVVVGCSGDGGGWECLGVGGGPLGCFLVRFALGYGLREANGPMFACMFN